VTLTTATLEIKKQAGLVNYEYIAHLSHVPYVVYEFKDKSEGWVGGCGWW
jgi:hypothetical protein